MIKAILASVVFGGLQCPVGDLHPAKFLSVVDGDTADVDIDLGMDTTRRARLRLLRIDAPEMHDKDASIRLRANEAKAYLWQQLSSASELVLCTGKTDSFGRWLSEVWVDGVNVNQRLLDLGLAQPFVR